MEKQKLLKLITKIYKPNFSRLAPTDIYTHFVSVFPYNEYSKVMTGKDIILASFLSPLVETPEVLDSKYDEIAYNLFAYSIIEVDLDYSETECHVCNGDGYESCDDCDGNGNEECPDCDGDGSDEEGDSCGYCDGDGRVSCDRCDGDGTINCYECGGSGNWDDYDRREISQWYFASYNTELLDDYVKMDEFDEVDSDSIYSNDNKTISLRRNQTSIQNPSHFDLEKNSVYFYEVTDSPVFNKMINNRVTVDNLNELED